MMAFSRLELHVSLVSFFGYGVHKQITSGEGVEGGWKSLKEWEQWPGLGRGWGVGLPHTGENRAKLIGAPRTDLYMVA